MSEKPQLYLEDFTVGVCFTGKRRVAHETARSGRLSLDVRMLKDDDSICFDGTRVYQLQRKPEGIVT